MSDVSVVIPTHGRPRFLEEALRSVVQQRGVTIREIVVVDDLGTTETKELVEAIAEEMAALKVHYEHRSAPPNGASASRNAGFALTTAPFVAFLDDDDLWSPDHLSAAVEALSGGADLSLAWMNVLDADGVLRDHYSPRPSLNVADALARNPGITGSNLVVTRAAFTQIKGFDEALPVSNDKDFFVRFLQAGLPYVVVPRRAVTHRRHDGGQLTEWNERRAKGLEMYMAKHASSLTSRDRRFLARQVHSIRARSTHGVRRIREVALLVAKTELSDAVRKIATRIGRMTHRAARSRDVSAS